MGTAEFSCSAFPFTSAPPGCYLHAPHSGQFQSPASSPSLSSPLTLLSATAQDGPSERVASVSGAGTCPLGSSCRMALLPLLTCLTALLGVLL